VRKVFLTLAGGEIGARGLQVLAIVLLTRRVGMGPIGDYGLASSISAYAVLLVLQGFDTIGVRASTQKQVETRSAAEQIIALRLLSALAMAALTALWALHRPGDPAARLLFILSGVYFSNALTPRWLFVAVSRPRPLALAATLSQACFLGGVLSVRGPADLESAAWAQMAGEALAALCLWIAAGCLRPRLSGASWRFLLRESWPISLALIMGTALYNFDIVALGLFGRRPEAGPYLSSYRCITLFGPLLAALQNTILPRLAEHWPDRRAIRRKAELLSLATLLVLGLCALVLFAFASPVLRLLYGPAIGDADRLLRILIWVLPIQGVRAVLRQGLFAIRGQAVDLSNVTLSFLTNIGLDLALVPKFGAFGCAWSTLAAESVFLVSGCIALRIRTRTSAGHRDANAN
jgi:O-antigen/teichoic acid export membrane protein